MLNPALPFPYIVRISNSFFLEIWFKRGGMEMAKITQNLHQQVGERWANALRRRYGANTASKSPLISTSITERHTVGFRDDRLMRFIISALGSCSGWSSSTKP